MPEIIIEPGQSIQAAIDVNPAGTRFIFSRGLWREERFLAKANSEFIGDPQGGTILSGAIVLTQWTRQGGNNRWRHPGLPPPLMDDKPTMPGMELANHKNDL